MAEAGKSSSVDFSSCNVTTSGLAARSHRSRFGSRRLMLLMLKVAIFILTSCQAGAAGAEISVGITDRDDGEFGRTPRRPGAAIANGFALLDSSEPQDSGFQVDDRLHRIVGFGRRIDAVERSARPHQIELEMRAEENAGR